MQDHKLKWTAAGAAAQHWQCEAKGAIDADTLLTTQFL
jgi:hypothetical protein